ncbi:MAG: acetyl-CoA synthetase [Rhodothermales bacterium]|jgi:acetyl-CoA synthetase
MSELFEPSKEFSHGAHVGSRSAYDALYRQSIDDPDTFWADQSKRIEWFEPWKTVSKTSFARENVSIGWYLGGRTNASYNCLDRHLKTRGDQTALIFEPDNPEEDARHITYSQLHEEVCRFANVLKSRGVEKGDRVTIYLPMIPEAAAAMLACARIGAVHSVVFAGFSPESLANRILDCESDVVLTSDEGMRAGKRVPLKANTDKALEKCPDVHTVVVVRRSGGDIDWVEGRDVWYHEAKEQVSPVCTPESMDSEDPLFILYTSGSTGKPKGVLHTTGGYQVFTSLTHQYVFDYQEGDVFWCTADIGWITGHSYMVYGPLLNGATQVFFEGVPNYPDASRFWQVVDAHGVNQFYTAPTAIRALMSKGDAFVTRTNRSSLRLLGTVGEPINPEAWRWYNEVVGERRCPIVDTWWQTETGGILITPLPGAIATKPGSATLPFFGIEPEVRDADGHILEGEAMGLLVLKGSWPGQARTIYQDHPRFVATYFSAFPDRYFTGDGVRRDKDGYYWITGRVDDVINVSGHRMGTAEVESALVAHRAVAEAAVVGFPHEIKGQGIYCFVTLNAGVRGDRALETELINQVRTQIGPIARPDFIQFTPSVPKTRSGKIMRRLLRKIAANDFMNLGDTSTLADPSVLDDLIENRKNK